MDAADEGLLGALTERLQRHREPSWIDVHGLRAWRSGADVHVDLHLVVPRYYDADALHRIHDEIEAALAPTVRGGDVVAHFDPCRPHDCKTCAMPSCPVRTAPFERAVALRPERAVRGDDQVPH